MRHSVTPYNGEQKSLTAWAKQFGVTVQSFAAWVREHGMENAVTLAQMDYWDRKEWRAEQKKKMDKVPPAQPFDDDLEPKNRLYYYLKAGRTEEEIRIKARLL